jgi:hypothetical protein
MAFMERCANHVDDRWEHYPDCPTPPVRIVEKQDGYWLVIDKGTAQALININYNQRGPIVQAAIEAVAIDETGTRGDGDPGI